MKIHNPLQLMPVTPAGSLWQLAQLILGKYIQVCHSAGLQATQLAVVCLGFSHHRSSQINVAPSPKLGVCLQDLLFQELNSSKHAPSSLATWFRSSRGKPDQESRAIARAVLIDMEPKVIEAAYQSVDASNSGWQYISQQHLCQQSGSGNNWAQGHHVLGPACRDAAVDLIRREAEACDFFEGLLLLQSMAGGTGAGLGSYVAEACVEEFPAAQLVSCCVWPFARGEVNVQPYNTLLTLAQLLEVSDGILLLQNEVLKATAQKQLGIKAPGFQDLNKLAAGALAGALLPAAPRPTSTPPSTPQASAAARSSPAGPSSRPTPAQQAASSRAAVGKPSAAEDQAGGLEGGAPTVLLYPLADLVHHLYSHPRYKVASVRHYPQLAAASVDFTSFSWGPCLKRLRQMFVTGTLMEEGLSWGASAAGLGLYPLQGGLPHHRYKNRAASSMLLLRGRGAAEVAALEFADPAMYPTWCPQPLAVASHPAGLGRCPLAATLLATDKAAVQPVGAMLQRAHVMMGAGAYLHQYEACGLSKGDMMEALLAVEDCKAAYEVL